MEFDCKGAIEQGISFLNERQLSNGEFSNYMSGDEDMKGWISKESSIFPTALIGLCLLKLKGFSKVKDVLDRTAQFLLVEKGPYNTWNHFTSHHPLRKICPQDIDDTVLVSNFLKAMNYPKEVYDNHQLIFHNKREDDLFYTWFTFRFKSNSSKDYWKLAARELKVLFKSVIFWTKFECTRYDVDTVVNANILSYLGVRGETESILPHLVGVIRNSNEGDCDSWYRNIFTVYYFISKSYNSDLSDWNILKELIVQRIILRRRKDGGFGDSTLDTALAISTLNNLRIDTLDLQKDYKYIMDSQNEGGGWNKRVFYYGGPKKLSGFGSEELTTAFCLEALTFAVN